MPRWGLAQLKRTMGLWMATALVVGNMSGRASSCCPPRCGRRTARRDHRLALHRPRCRAACARVRTAGSHVPAYWRALCIHAQRASATSSDSRRPGATGSPSGPATPPLPPPSSATSPCSGATSDNGDMDAALVGIAVMGSSRSINTLGIAQGGIVQVVTTVLKFVPIAIIAVVGLFFMNTNNLTPFAPHGTWSADLSRGAAHAVGLHRPRVRDGGGGGGQGPRAEHPARDDHRHAASDDRLHRRDGGRSWASFRRMSSPARPARSPIAAGAIFGGSWDKVIAVVAHGVDVRSAERLDPASGSRAAGGGGGRAVPQAVREGHGKRRTPVFGLVVSSVLVTGLMLMNYTQGRWSTPFTFVILLATLTTLMPVRLLGRGRRRTCSSPSPERFDAQPSCATLRSPLWLSPTPCGRSPAPARTSSPRASCCSCRASRSTSSSNGGRRATRAAAADPRPADGGSRHPAGAVGSRAVRPSIAPSAPSAARATSPRSTSARRSARFSGRPAPAGPRAAAADAAPTRTTCSSTTCCG